MARETVATCECLICKTPGAEIRRNIKGKLYLMCSHSCGLVQATGAGAQTHLEAALATATPAPAPAPILAPEPADVPDLEGLDNPTGQPVVTKRRGLLGALSDPIF